MCKFIGKSNEWIFCKLSKSEILRLYSIVHVAMETTKMSNFTCQSKSFISIFFTCQVSSCKLQPFSCHDLANDIYSRTARTVFSHLKYRTCSTLSLLWRPWANILTVLPDSSTWNLESRRGIQNPRLSSLDSLTWDEMTSKLEMALCQLQGLVIVCHNSTHASRALTSGYSGHAGISYTVVYVLSRHCCCRHTC